MWKILVPVYRYSEYRYIGTENTGRPKLRSFRSCRGRRPRRRPRRRPARSPGGRLGRPTGSRLGRRLQRRKRPRQPGLAPTWPSCSFQAIREWASNPNFGRSVLGCIDKESRYEILMFQRHIFLRSTRSTRFCNAPNLTFDVYRMIQENFGEFSGFASPRKKSRKSRKIT